MYSRQEYEIKLLHANLSDARWVEVFTFRQQYAQQTNTVLTFASWQALKEQYVAYLNLGHKIGLVRKQGEAAGILLFYRRRNLGDSFVFLQYDSVDSYLNQALLGQVFESFRANWSCAKFLVITSINQQNDYLEKVRSLEVSEHRELFELQLDQVNKARLEAWSVAEVDDELTVVTESELPHASMHEFYALISELTESVEYKSRLFDGGMLSPEKIKLRHQGYERKGATYLALLLARKGELIGYTEILIEAGTPHVAHQNMTGVKKAYRGRGLGKRLKALMIQRLLQEYPDISLIKTAVHIKNAPSQRLNRQLGFQAVGVYKEYVISKECIADYLRDSRFATQ